MRLRQRFAIGLLGAMAACAAPAPDNPSEGLSIAPRDFVLLPCGPARSDQPCALVAAGGKRVLFGAPAGVAASLSEADLRQLDSVVLFSLRARDLEGVDEIRNESWRAGRDTPLLTIGPRGVLVLVDGINKAFEQADALRIVEQGIPPGGYDAAILTGREAGRGEIVFDTGDVRVRRISGGYRISYEDRAAVDLIPCDATGADVTTPDAANVQVSVICEGSEPDLAWPLTAPHFVVRQASAN